MRNQLPLPRSAPHRLLRLLPPCRTLVASMMMSMAVLLALNACTERSRLNPIDPENPRTAGKPTGLHVLAELDTIQLSWDALDLRDLSGFNVYRRRGDESGYVLVGQTAATRTSFREVSTRLGVLHSYRITARVENLESPPSDSVIITPGPASVWVADSDSRAVVKLTHDGRNEILRSRAFLSPYRLKVDPRRAVIWVLDEYTGDFGSLTSQGALRGMYEHFFRPVDMALDFDDGSVWVGDNGEHVIAHFDANGRVLARLDSLPELGALTFHPTVKEIWALTKSGEQLLRIGRSQHLTRVKLLPTWTEPVTDLVPFAGTGDVWIAAGKRVARMNLDAQIVYTSNEDFRLATRIAVEPASGACWVLDDSRELRPTSSVFKLNAQGQMQFKVDGFERPQALAVNPYDNSCYVLDTLQGRLVKVTAAGEITEGYNGFLTPFDIEIVLPEK